MNKKNLIITIAVVFVAIVGLTLAIIAMCGGFRVYDEDYRKVSGKKYSEELSSYIIQVANWNGTVISYDQLYADGQEISIRTEEIGSNSGDYRMFHTLSVTGQGAYSEKCSYIGNTFIRVFTADGQSTVTSETVTAESRFDQLKKQFSGDYRKYVNAFTSDVFDEILIMRQADGTYYKVIFSDEMTARIMGSNSRRLQILLSVKDGKTLLLRFIYDKKANPLVSDDEDSSIILEFSDGVDQTLWEDLSASL